jgi:hypothetical protein
MRNFILLVIALIGIMAWQSCQYEWFDPVDYVPPPPGDTTSFSLEVVPIFERSCNSCHKTGSVPPDLTPANAYTSLWANNQIDTAAPENSMLYLKCATGGSMNKYCQPGDPEIMLQWIKEGAKNN